MAKVLADITFRDPDPPLLANADAHLITTADGCRAELVDHLTTGVDWVGAIETMRAAGVTTFIEIGPGQVLTGLIKRIAPDSPRPRPGRPGLRGPPRDPVRRHRGRRRLSTPHHRAAHPQPIEEEPVRQPDFTRRVVVTGLGVISPVGNDKDTAWSALVNGRSGLAEITKFDASGYAQRWAGEVKDFDPGQWMDHKAMRRSEATMWFGVAAAKQAVADAGPRDHGRQPRGHRRRVRLGRRRSVADDRQRQPPAREGPEPRRPDIHRQRPGRLRRPG